MIYTYLLIDNGGVSNSENEIIIPKGTRFRHEFGVYEVMAWLNDKGQEEQEFNKITQVSCERKWSNFEIKNGKK